MNTMTEPLRDLDNLTIRMEGLKSMALMISDAINYGSSAGQDYAPGIDLFADLCAEQSSNLNQCKDSLFKIARGETLPQKA